MQAFIHSIVRIIANTRHPYPLARLLFPIYDSSCVPTRVNMITQLLLLFLSHIPIVAYTSNNLPACYPANTPCPYKDCLKLRVDYLNESGQDRFEKVTISEDISIDLGGLAGLIHMKANRHFSATIASHESTDCIFDTKELLRATALSKMKIELKEANTRTYDCTILLSPKELKGSHTYDVHLRHHSDGLHCYVNLQQ